MRATPLLPTHHATQVKPAKRTRRKGGWMRLFILIAVLGGLGYAAFAFKYLASSKIRAAARQGVKTTLERRPAGDAAGYENQGRGLKAEEAARASIEQEAREEHGHDLGDGDDEVLHSAYTGSYDHIVEDDPNAHEDSVGYTVGEEDDGEVAGEHFTLPIPAHDIEAHTPKHRSDPTHQEPQSQAKADSAKAPNLAVGSRIEADVTAEEKLKQAVREPSLAVGSRIEADVIAEEKLKEQVKAPGLAVGSRIEADVIAEEKLKEQVKAPGLAVGSRLEPESSGKEDLVEPGGSPKPKRPTFEVGSPQPDIPVTLTEPDAHQDAVPVKAPVVGGPIEADSHTKVPVKEPVLAGPVEADSHTKVPVREPVLAGPVEGDAHTKVPVKEPMLSGPVEGDAHTQGAVHAPRDVVSEKPVDRGQAPKIEAPKIEAPKIEAPKIEAPVIAPSPIIDPPRENDGSEVIKSPAADPKSPNPFIQGLYTMEAVDIDGKTRHLSEFAGKVTIVVNVASACGFTDENYKGLQEVYNKYHKHGLEILAFPCNQFGQQEPKDEPAIKEFCTGTYHVTFPMFSKIDVNGANAHPIYKFLKRDLPVNQNGGGGSGPGKELIWNFQKIIVDYRGQPVRLFYQGFDGAALEKEVYTRLREARAAGAVQSAKALE